MTVKHVTVWFSSISAGRAAYKATYRIPNDMQTMDINIHITTFLMRKLQVVKSRRI